MKKLNKEKIIHFFKKKKRLIILSAVLLVLLTLGITFGRYIYQQGYNYILESQGFYFNSTMVTPDSPSPYVPSLKFCTWAFLRKN